MPFIDAKVSVKLTEEKKETVKAKLGKAISVIPGKSEGWLMVGLTDEYCLYFKGNQNDETAFVQVQVYGGENPAAFDKLTGEICNILNDELAIPKDRIYVAYQATANWGWNGRNF